MTFVRDVTLRENLWIKTIISPGLRESERKRERGGGGEEREREREREREGREGEGGRWPDGHTDTPTHS